MNRNIKKGKILVCFITSFRFILWTISSTDIFGKSSMGSTFFSGVNLLRIVGKKDGIHSRKWNPSKSGEICLFPRRIPLSSVDSVFLDTRQKKMESTQESGIHLRKAENMAIPT
ncbi:MAG: hypothetical protein KAH48_04260, partial [Chlorobi bacterium]|nr:hypothetical protein [Chlorobiota bacterium]